MKKTLPLVIAFSAAFQLLAEQPANASSNKSLRAAFDRALVATEICRDASGMRELPDVGFSIETLGRSSPTFLEDLVSASEARPEGSSTLDEVVQLLFELVKKNVQEDGTSSLLDSTNLTDFLSRLAAEVDFLDFDESDDGQELSFNIPAFANKRVQPKLTVKRREASIFEPLEMGLTEALGEERVAELSESIDNSDDVSAKLTLGFQRTGEPDPSTEAPQAFRPVPGLGGGAGARLGMAENTVPGESRPLATEEVPRRRLVDWGGREGVQAFSSPGAEAEEREVHLPKRSGRRIGRSPDFALDEGIVGRITRSGVGAGGTSFFAESIDVVQQSGDSERALRADLEAIAEGSVQTDNFELLLIQAALHSYVRACEAAVVAAAASMECASACEGDMALRAHKAVTEAKAAGADELMSQLETAADVLAEEFEGADQAVLSVERRYRDGLAGPDETVYKFTYEMGQNEDEGETSFQSLLSARNATSAVGLGDMRWSLSIERKEVESYSDEEAGLDEEDRIGFSAEESETTTASLGVMTEVCCSTDGDALAMINFSVDYEDVSGDPLRERERLVGELSATRKLGPNLDLSIGFQWANKPEFLGEVDEELSSRFGLKYSLPNLTNASALKNLAESLGLSPE